MHSNIKLIVSSDYEIMSVKAADIFAEEIKKNPTKSFGFATGSTPLGMYRELIRKYKKNEVDFSGISSFNLDEYYPIDRESDQSYYYFMQNNLFNHVNMNKDRINIPDGKAVDPHIEANNFEKKIFESGGIKMQILGIGLNGHIGFNEPDDAFGTSTRFVPLDQVTIESNSIHFSDISQVPHNAITMGIRTIMMSEHILLLAHGKTKANILRTALLGSITPNVPASVLQLHPSVTVLTDKDAASLL